jgi:hypothetical protein
MAYKLCYIMNLLRKERTDFGGLFLFHPVVKIVTGDL